MMATIHGFSPMTKFLCLAAFAATLIATSPVIALGAEKPLPAGAAAPMMGVDAATFVKVVASSNQFEIRSSGLAGSKASSEDVKAFATSMIADHKMAEANLKKAGDMAQTAAPSADAPLAPKHQKMLAQLEAASGKEFETLYIDMQSQAHKEAVALFRTYAGAGEAQPLVGFAKETLPTLEMHLGHVELLVARH